jgi:hypothetical protein
MASVDAIEHCLTHRILNRILTTWMLLAVDLLEVGAHRDAHGLGNELWKWSGCNRSLS